ncbi:MAG: HAD-IIIC family phosphatase, partial [Acidobacteriaceae bacterium]|nr:HAD-IIIC family phosphatase [Acidobacteriaceae bacterium]
LVSGQALEQQSPPSERFDVKSELLSGFPYTLAHASAVTELLAAAIHNPPPKKGLITDLDDTLWSGILGELGVEGISWSLDQQTQMYGLYQQFLGSLASTGTLIGIASKNDPGLVKQAFERSDLILSEHDIFPMEIHWDRKSESVARILKTWNIGPESVVFVDDSAMEAAEVQSAFPEMLCLTFPSTDVRGIWNLLHQLRRLFGKSAVSEEDSIRLQSIRTAHSLNESIRQPRVSADEFLAEAKASIAFSIGKHPGDSRALELINKTNQFNLNGRRFTEAAYEHYLKHPHSFLITAGYRDKYGPLGRIAVLMGTSEGRRVNLDVWVMSCRAFSRRIEHQCLKYLFDTFDTEEVVLDCQATPRNAPLQEFLTQLSDEPFASGLTIYRRRFYEIIPPLFHQIEETVDA